MSKAVLINPDDSCLTVPYTSLSFPPSYGITSGHQTFSLNEIFWAALTVGRPNLRYVFQHGTSSIFEAVFRLSLIVAALDRTPLRQGGYQLRRSDAFRALDPTEKGAVTYFLGMAICKLFASRCLKVHWTLHTDVFGKQYSVEILGRSRPDLFGQDANGDWYAFEAKGRSNLPSARDKTRAKAQARRLVRVAGRRCSLNIGSFVFFHHDLMEFYWTDPEPEDPANLEPIEISVEEEDWANYYALALALTSQQDSDFQRDLVERLDLKVEIYPSVRARLVQGEWNAARSLAIELGQVLNDEGFQPDGLRVVAGTSWQRPVTVVGDS